MEQQWPAQGTASRRVNVLAFPPPSTGRYVAFVLALMAAGLFSGNWLHNEIAGDDWARATLDCHLGTPSPDVSLSAEAALAQTQAVQQCLAPVERARAYWSLAGAAIISVVAIAVMYVRPSFVRRHRQLSLLPPTMAPVLNRVRELSAEAGLRQPPALFTGPTLRDPFCFGAPGRYALAIPRKAIALLQRPGPVDALIRHELAHIKHRDVGLAWLAKTTWYTVGPLLAIPIVLAVIQQDYSLLPSYIWRATLLAIIIEVTSASLLRSREHDADLAAGLGPGHLEALDAWLSQITDSRRANRWSAVLARHPAVQARRDVLRAPEWAAKMRFTDAVAAAFLASFAVPLIVSTMTTLLTGSGLGLFAFAMGALLVGPILGATIGFGLWRSELMSDAAAEVGSAKVARSCLPAAALGTGAGLGAGESASLAQAGTDMLGLDWATWVLIPVLLGMGTVGLAASLARLYARTNRLARRPATAWGTGLAVNIVLFTAASWAWISLQYSVDRLGWTVARGWIIVGLATPAYILGIFLLLLASLAGLRLSVRAKAVPVPPWLATPTPAAEEHHRAATFTGAPSPLQTLMAGLVSGTLAAITIVVWRLWSGPAVADAAREEVVWTVIWICAGTCAAVAFAGLAVYPSNSAAFALVAGPVSALVTLFGFLAFNAWRDGSFSAGLLFFMLGPILGIGFVFTLGTGFAAVLVKGAPAPRSSWTKKKGILLAANGTFAVTGSVILILTAPLVLYTQPSQTGLAQQNQGTEAEIYSNQTAQQFQSDYMAIDLHLQAAGERMNRDPESVPSLFRESVIPAATDLRIKVEQYRPQSEDVRVVHAHLVRAVKLCEEKSKLFGEAIELNNGVLFEEAVRKQEEEGVAVTEWMDGVEALRSLQTGGP